MRGGMLILVSSTRPAQRERQTGGETGPTEIKGPAKRQPVRERVCRSEGEREREREIKGKEKMELYKKKKGQQRNN